MSHKQSSIPQNHCNQSSNNLINLLSPFLFSENAGKQTRKHDNSAHSKDSKYPRLLPLFFFPHFLPNPKENKNSKIKKFNNMTTTTIMIMKKHRTEIFRRKTKIIYIKKKKRNEPEDLYTFNVPGKGKELMNLSLSS